MTTAATPRRTAPADQLTDAQREHIDRLLARLTWEEKLNQAQITFKMSLDECLDAARTGIGALFWPGNAADTNAVQRAAVEESTHGIPLLIGLDVIHGQRTTFPAPLALAATFDPDAARTCAAVSAAEARSGGVTWTFSPMVDVSRDPRWGRVAEGFGEDPLLTGAMGAAMVEGYQHERLDEPGTLVATAKHYIGYGAAEGGRDYNTVDMSAQRLRSVYLPPFEDVVHAGAGSVMASFNTLNGRPVHANRRLLTDLLKASSFSPVPSSATPAASRTSSPTASPPTWPRPPPPPCLPASTSKWVGTSTTPPPAPTPPPC